MDSIGIEPWSEEKQVTEYSTHPTGIEPAASRHPDYSPYTFDNGQSTAQVMIRLAGSSGGGTLVSHYRKNKHEQGERHQSNEDFWQHEKLIPMQ